MIRENQSALAQQEEPRQAVDSKTYVEQLLKLAHDSNALQHPYLNRLATGSYDNLPRVLSDLVNQYAYFQEAFAEYLRAVMQHLSSAKHQALLQEFIKLEIGTNQKAHAPKVLYDKLLHAQINDAKKEAACLSVLFWKQQFSHLCQSEISAYGIGALGLATVAILPDIYQKILQGFEHYLDINSDDRTEFLAVHSELCQYYRTGFETIATEMAKDHSQRDALRVGVETALNLQAMFWDTMLKRAR